MGRMDNQENGEGWEVAERTAAAFEGKGRMEIGQAIRDAREDVNMTRPELAAHVGKDWRTIARWELEGTSHKNLVTALRGISGARQNMSGAREKALLLSKVSTVDLVVELMGRARLMEERDARLLAFKKDLEARQLGHLFPMGL